MNLANAHQAVLYIDGVALLGNISEVELPELASNTHTHEVLGGTGEVELPGHLSKMEAKIKTNAPYRQLEVITSDMTRIVTLTLMANVQVVSPEGAYVNEPRVYIMRGFPKKSALGTFKQTDKNMPEYEFTVSYLEVKHANVTILEVDLLTLTYKVNGVDLSAQIRSNLGL